MKRIKYFIASAGNLAEERSSIETFLSRKNDSLIKEGVYIETVIWEKLSNSFSTERIQNVFNKELLKCDVMICLVFDKVGRFTYEEFSTAVSNFMNGENPKKIYVYFKDAPIYSSELNSDFNSVLKLKEDIKSLEQYPVKYSNVAELLLDIDRNFKIDYKTFKEEILIEQINAFLNNINPMILNLFNRGNNEVRVFITQENLSKYDSFIKELSKRNIIDLIDNAHTMTGFGVLPNGIIADKNQSGSSRSRLFTMKILDNFKNFH